MVLRFRLFSYLRSSAFICVHLRFQIEIGIKSHFACFFLSNCASKAMALGGKSTSRTKLAGLARAVFAVHLAVFPFDRERAVVARCRSSARMISSKLMLPRPRLRKSQARRGSPKLSVPAEDAGFARQLGHVGVLHVHVEDALARTCG